MKTWFITGASRGFGALIMEAALATDAVVATARDPSSIADHPRLLRLPLDVTNEAQARAAAATAIEKFGSIDVLVNNAGVSSGGGSCCPFLASLKHSYRLNKKMQMTLPGNLCDVFVRN